MKYLYCHTQTFFSDNTNLYLGLGVAGAILILVVLVVTSIVIMWKVKVHIYYSFCGRFEIFIKMTKTLYETIMLFLYRIGFVRLNELYS